MATESGVVLVTGASGYIASHVVQQLQQQGYTVRGTVRSLENTAKVKPLKELCPEAEHPLELVEANLTDPDCWEIALKDCTHVIHVASPFPNHTPKDENELIQPAVDGTLNVLKACVAVKTVRRVVLTSSIVAVNEVVPSAKKKVKAGILYSEDDWTDIESSEPYAKSKTMAEKAAWDFVEQLSDDQKFELVAINPAYVMGPTLVNSPFTSMELPKRLMERMMPAVPHINFSLVDVRDVAAAHIKGMTCKEASGGRFIICNDNVWLMEIAEIISKEFKIQGYNVPTLNCPYFVLWITSLFDKSVKMVLPVVGKVTRYDNTKMRNVLHIEPRKISDTIIDMCYSLIEHGLVVKKPKYRERRKNVEEETGKRVEKTTGEAETSANVTEAKCDDADNGLKRDDTDEGMCATNENNDRKSNKAEDI